MKSSKISATRVKSRRPFRVAELLREELAAVLTTKMRDPRLQPPWVTITEIDVSPDLKNAKVYFSSLNPAADIPAMTKALQGAAPFLRTAMSQRLEGGFGVPVLHFFHDELIEDGLRIDQLISDAVAKAAD